MSGSPFRAWRLPTMGALLSIVLTGCGDAAAPELVEWTDLSGGPEFAVTAAQATRGELNVCSVGSDATVTIDVTGGPTSTISLTDGACQLVGVTPSGSLVGVTLTDAPAVGNQLDVATVDQIIGSRSDPVGRTRQTVLVSLTVSVKISIEHGATVTFSHVPEQGT